MGVGNDEIQGHTDRKEDTKSLGCMRVDFYNCDKKERSYKKKV